jgi:hypothetical protein
MLVASCSVTLSAPSLARCQSTPTFEDRGAIMWWRPVRSSRGTRTQRAAWSPDAPYIAWHAEQALTRACNIDRWRRAGACLPME